MLEALQTMSSVILDPFLLLLIFATTIIGVIIGVLPGIGATTGAALLLPFTLTMTPVHAITVLATIYVSATFAGSITAILINTPGPLRRARRLSVGSLLPRVVKPEERWEWLSFPAPSGASSP